MTNDEFNIRIVAGDRIPFPGYVSSFDKTVASPAALVRGSKNVYKKDSTTIANRPGLKRRGAADSTVAKTDSSFEWETSLGFTRPLRINNGNLQVESDVVESGTYVWYSLLTGQTQTRWNFAPWWDNSTKKDKLIMCNGTDDLTVWEGGIGKLLATTINSIQLTANAAPLGFVTAGNVLINGNTYAYTGITNDTLTGVTPDPTGEAADSAVVAATSQQTSKPAANFLVDFIKTIGNRLHCGSNTSRLIYISDNSDYTNFTVPTPRIPGSAEILTLDNTAKGIAVRKGNAHISAGTQDWYRVEYTPITVGTTLTEQTLVEKLPTANLEAALAHEFIDNVGDDIVYVTVDKKMKVLGTFRSLQDSRFPTISDQIAEELANEDLTGGHLKAVGEYVYVTAPLNGRVWIRETSTELDRQGNIISDSIWHAPFIWNIARIAVIDGVQYGHSNANPQLYQLWDTEQWQDDSPSDEPLPYDCIAAFGYDRAVGAGRHRLTNVTMVYYEGYLSEGTELTGAVLLNYQGDDGAPTVTINSPSDPASLYSGDVGLSLGDSSLGDNPLGDQTSEEELDQDMLPKFRVIQDLEAVDCFEYQVRVYSSAVGSRWELLCYGTNATESDSEPSEIRK